MSEDHDLKSCDNTSSDQGAHCLTPEERGRILVRIHSALYWVGEFIPEDYELDGKRVNLRNTIFDYITKDRPTEEDVRNAMALADRLDMEAKGLEKTLRGRDITVDDARRLLAEVCGLLRGVEELRKLSKERNDPLKRILMEKVNDERRWMDFTKEIR